MTSTNRLFFFFFSLLVLMFYPQGFWLIQVTELIHIEFLLFNLRDWMLFSGVGDYSILNLLASYSLVLTAFWAKLIFPLYKIHTSSLDQNLNFLVLWPKLWLNLLVETNITSSKFLMKMGMFVVIDLLESCICD